MVEINRGVYENDEIEDSIFCGTSINWSFELRHSFQARTIIAWEIFCHLFENVKQSVIDL